MPLITGDLRPDDRPRARPDRRRGHAGRGHPRPPRGVVLPRRRPGRHPPVGTTEVEGEELMVRRFSSSSSWPSAWSACSPGARPPGARTPGLVVLRPGERPACRRPTPPSGSPPRPVRRRRPVQCWRRCRPFASACPRAASVGPPAPRRHRHRVAPPVVGACPRTGGLRRAGPGRPDRSAPGGAEAASGAPARRGRRHQRDLPARRAGARDRVARTSPSSQAPTRRARARRSSSPSPSPATTPSRSPPPPASRPHRRRTATRSRRRRPPPLRSSPSSARHLCIRWTSRPRRSPRARRRRAHAGGAGAA